jgi:hypothetical protein
VGRFLGRGEKPIELGDSWLPKKEFQFNFKLTIRTTNQNVNLKYSQKRDSSLGKGKNLK